MPTAQPRVTQHFFVPALSQKWLGLDVQLPRAGVFGGTRRVQTQAKSLIPLITMRYPRLSPLSDSSFPVISSYLPPFETSLSWSGCIFLLRGSLRSDLYAVFPRVDEATMMALTTASSSLRVVFRLGLVWYSGMISWTIAQTTTLPASYMGVSVYGDDRPRE